MINVWIPLPTLVNQVVNGMALGMLLALMAVGLTITLGLMRVVNMAHGALYTLGAYVLISVFNWAGFWPALLVAPLVVGLIGLLIESVLIRPLYVRDPLHTLLLTFGLALIVEDVVRIVWDDVPYPMAAPPALAGIVLLGDIPYSKYRVFVIAVTAVVMTGTWLFLERTQVGRTIVAGTFDREMVRVLGIRINLVFTLVFALGAALAAFAGVLAAPIRGVFPAMGSSIIMPSFVVVILGGMGSFWGALVGGVAVGVVVSLTVEVFSAASDVIVFVLLALGLLLRPRGLFGIEGLLER
jgi:branched-chain amino acid transport system permease protein